MSEREPVFASAFNVVMDLLMDQVGRRDMCSHMVMIRPTIDPDLEKRLVDLNNMIALLKPLREAISDVRKDLDEEREAILCELESDPSND
jgi:hypothetical protein